MNAQAEKTRTQQSISHFQGFQEQKAGDEPLLSIADNRAEAAAQRKLQGIADRSRQVLNTDRINRGMNEPPGYQGTGVIQRVSINRLKSQLVSDSKNRDKTRSFLAILTNLEEAGRIEALGVKSEKSTELVRLLHDTRTLIPSAKSTKRNKVTRKSRNDALDNLDMALAGKLDMLAKTVAARQLREDEKFRISDGPKAGFEVEFNNVILFDIEKITDTALDLLLRVRTDSELRHQWFDNARFPKREVLFSSPNGTWEGTADSTLKLCSNLEVVTKPLTPNQWREHGSGAEQDQVVFAELVQAINDAPRFDLLFPAELHPGLKLHYPGVRLIKLGNTLTPQSQMTAAGRVEKNTHELPGWWIGGLNWNALSFIIQIREGLETNSFHKQNNPKSGAFMKHGRNIILKTPILQLLGTPDEIPDNETIRVWMEKMAGILGVDPGMPVGEHGIVAISNLPASKSKNFNLESTGFTWGDYLSELVKGRDLVTQWAKNAFVTGSEDIGLGQLGDPSLGQDYAIEEHRQFSGEDSENYLPFARQWAETGNVP